MHYSIHPSHTKNVKEYNGLEKKYSKKRCVLGQNLTGYAFKCTLYPNICNKTSENNTQIYAVRKLVPKCAYLSRTEIRLTRVTI
jgi:hypothetical protein